MDNTMIEYPGGQLALAAEAVEPSGQLIIAEARPAIPTPPVIARDAVERAAVEERDALAGRAVRMAEPGAEPRAEVTILAEATNRRGERVTLAHIGRGWVPAGAMMRWAEPHYRVRVEGGYLGPSGATFTDESEARARFARLSGQDEPRAMSRAELTAKLAAPRRRGEPYRCARCDRELEPERWVYSHHTGARYCWPGEGCNTTKEG